jgi:hypothetical protein
MLLGEGDTMSSCDFFAGSRDGEPPTPSIARNGRYATSPVNRVSLVVWPKEEKNSVAHTAELDFWDVDDFERQLVVLRQQRRNRPPGSERKPLTRDTVSSIAQRFCVKLKNEREHLRRPGWPPKVRMHAPPSETDI